jgi:hypothetical protein
MKRFVILLAGLVATTALVAGGHPAPAAADGALPRTVFIVDAEPGVPLLPNDVAVLEAPTDEVEVGANPWGAFTVVATNAVRDVRWFVRGQLLPADSAWTGTRTGMWQSGIYQTTYLDVSGGPFSQGCQRSSSRFTIHELETAADGHVTTFALSFSWHCDGAIPAVYGEVRLNSTVPVSALRADRNRVGFDPVMVGVPTAAETVTLANAGSVDQQATVRLTGLDVDAFEVVEDDCTGAVLTPAATCGITVRFVPIRDGPARAMLEIEDGTARGLRTVDLEGTTVP